jgi:hypothetical protein
VALDQASLQSEILRIGEELSSSKTASPPAQVNGEVAQKWADVYVAYALNALAGPLKPIAMDGSTIVSGLLGTPKDFAVGLANGLTAFWATVMFAGPGFIPANPCTPGTYVGQPVAVQIKAFPLEKDPQAASARIANVLHIYTTGITVTATTTTVPPVVTYPPVI